MRLHPPWKERGQGGGGGGGGGRDGKREGRGKACTPAVDRLAFPKGAWGPQLRFPAPPVLLMPATSEKEYLFHSGTWSRVTVFPQPQEMIHREQPRLPCSKYFEQEMEGTTRGQGIWAQPDGETQVHPCGLTGTENGPKASTEPSEFSQGGERAPTVAICPVPWESPELPSAGAGSWAPTKRSAVRICQGECEGQEM